MVKRTLNFFRPTLICSLYSKLSEKETGYIIECDKCYIDLCRINLTGDSLDFGPCA